MTAQAGTFQSSSNGAPSANGQQRGSLEPGVPDITRKDSHGGPPEMRATINDIQNHLDEMHLNKAAAPAGGAITGGGANGARPPPPISRNQSIDETSSLASRSTRDDASSIRDHEGGFDSQRTSTGSAMAPHAKENLARNIQLAQEREERKRIAEEQEREAERERVRLSGGGPPVEGLVLTDESDIEEDSDDDDDSIFPSRRRTSGDNYAAGSREQHLDVPDNRIPTPAQDETPLVGAKQNGRFSPALQGPTTPPITIPATGSSNTIVEQDEDSAYPTPAIEEPVAPLEDVRAPSPARPTSGARTTTQSSDQAMRSSSPSSLTGISGAVDMTRNTTARPTQGDLEPPSPMGQGETSRRGSVESEQFVVSKRDTPVDMSSPESSPIAAASQSFRAPATGTRYSSDAASPPGQEGLLTIVEQAQSQSPVILNAPNPPRQSAASSIGAVQPASPYQSTAGSSRAGSTLGTAFTPATSAGYEASPRSATFPSRTPTLSDPREWSIEQVIEWGQSKNFDNQVLGKFRGKLFAISIERTNSRTNERDLLCCRA